MEKRIIWRGALAGAAAGVVAYVFARLFVEPVIGRAIGFEDGLGEALAHDYGGHEHGVELFSRPVQANIGMGFGVLAFGVAMGLLFAVVYCVAYQRVARVSARWLSVLVAAGMLWSLYVVPFLKYPANPPAGSLDETIRQRTLLYVLMVALSATLFIAAIWLGHRLARRFGGWNGGLMAAGAYVVALATVMLVLPTIDETPGPLLDESGRIIFEGFPADDLYEFRLYALGVQVILWVTIALVFAPMAVKLLGENRRERLVPA